MRLLGQQRMCAASVCVRIMIGIVVITRVLGAVALQMAVRRSRGEGVAITKADVAPRHSRDLQRGQRNQAKDDEKFRDESAHRLGGRLGYAVRG